MGKTWAANCFRLLGVPVHDADGCVHAILRSHVDIQRRIGAAFPGVLDAQGAVDRNRLAARVFNGGDRELKILEAILHPEVRNRQRAFLAQQARYGAPVVVLEVPLLYETGADIWVDGVVVVSAPAWLQKCRALKRPQMTQARFDAILARQRSDVAKRHAADFVVSTRTHHGGLKQISSIIKIVCRRPGRVWAPGWGFGKKRR